MYLVYTEFEIKLKLDTRKFEGILIERESTNRRGGNTGREGGEQQQQQQRGKLPFRYKDSRILEELWE